MDEQRKELRDRLVKLLLGQILKDGRTDDHELQALKSVTRALGISRGQFRRYINTLSQQVDVQPSDSVMDYESFLLDAEHELKQFYDLDQVSGIIKALRECGLSSPNQDLKSVESSESNSNPSRLPDDPSQIGWTSYLGDLCKFCGGNIYTGPCDGTMTSSTDLGCFTCETPVCESCVQIHEDAGAGHKICFFCQREGHTTILGGRKAPWRNPVNCTLPENQRPRFCFECLSRRPPNEYRSFQRCGSCGKEYCPNCWGQVSVGGLCSTCNNQGQNLIARLRGRTDKCIKCKSQLHYIEDRDDVIQAIEIHGYGRSKIAGFFGGSDKSSQYMDRFLVRCFGCAKPICQKCNSLKSVGGRQKRFCHKCK